MNSDPRQNSTANHFSVIEAITPEIEAMAGGANLSDGLGTGGMITKLLAAKIAGASGAQTLIADGRVHRPMTTLLNRRFSLFKAQNSVKAAYKAWIKGSVAPFGKIIIDEGAKKALNAGRSLLPSGICGLTGRFDQGETVSILDQSGHEIARGIVEYDSGEISKIMGGSSQDIESRLGYSSADEVIHRDDLVMM